MKILVAAPQAIHEDRGTPVSTRRMIASLTAAGHRVDVLSYPIGRNGSLAPARTFRSRGLPGIEDVPVGPSWRKLALDGPFTAAIARHAEPGAYDVVHAVEEAIFPALLLRRWHGARVVYDMDSRLSEQILGSLPALGMFSVPIQRMEDWAIRASDLVLAVSNDLVRHARCCARSADLVHLLRDVPVEPVPTGAAPEDIRSLFPDADTIALYVGNLVGYQGIDLLLAAAEKLTDASRVGIVVIGGTDERIAGFRDEVAKRGIGNRIRFLGRRPLGDLSAYLAQADVLVSARTRGDNTPLKVYTYMAAGRAIAATRLSMHTQVLDDETAALFEPDGASLATVLESLGADEARRRKLGAAASARAAELYSAAAYDRCLREAYAVLR